MDGSPAWAGIDLQDARESLTQARFPRVGGDRPYGVLYARDAYRVPPRGRG